MTDYDSWTMDRFQKTKLISIILVLAITVGKLFYNSLAAGIPLFFIGLLFIPEYKKKCIEKRKNQLLIQFRDLLDSLAASISSGRSMQYSLIESIDYLSASYDESSMIITELNQMKSRMMNSNEEDSIVLRDFADRSHLEDVSDFVSVYETIKYTGGNLPLAISRAASIIADKINLEGELKSMMSEKAFEGRIVSLAPIAIVLFLRLTSPEYLLPLNESFKGNLIITFALALMGVSLVLTERISSIEI